MRSFEFPPSILSDSHVNQHARFRATHPKMTESIAAESIDLYRNETGRLHDATGPFIFIFVPQRNDNLRMKCGLKSYESIFLSRKRGLWQANAFTIKRFYCNIDELCRNENKAFNVKVAAETPYHVGWFVLRLCHEVIAQPFCLRSDLHGISGLILERSPHWNI